MEVVSDELNLSTKKEGEIIDVTEMAAEAVTKSGISNGIIVLFIPGSTAAITTIEYEPGLMKDFPEALERIAPGDIDYKHEKMWHDGNGRSHVKSAILKPDLTVPVRNRKLVTGTWQQIVFVELDVRPRKRKVEIQIIGE